MPLFRREKGSTADAGAIKDYVELTEFNNPEAEPIAQTFKGPHQEKYVVFCTGDMCGELADSKEEAEKIHQKFIERWRGTGIYPIISVAKIKESTEVF